MLVGNSQYENVTKLANPVADIELMSASLAKQGFETFIHKDADLKKFKRGLQQFFGKVADAGPDAVAVFYYAGHGLQVRGANYLIPTDAHIEKESDVDIEAIRADSIMEMIALSGSPLNIVILDACRNNPYRGFRSASRGLAQIDAPKGTLVAFSTAPGQVARDGPSGGNSPYSEALAKVLGEPGLRIEDVFKRVRKAVNAATQGDQVPWESSSLVGDFYPAGPPETGVQQTALLAPPPLPFTSRAMTMRLATAFPKSMYDTGPDPQPLAVALDKLSKGAIKVTPFAAGEIVPSLGVMDAVVAGTVELGWTPAGYYGKNKAFALASGAVPFGLTPEKLIVWAEGAGGELRNALYGKIGLKALPCSMIGTTGMYVTKELKTAADLTGLKLRFSGLAAEVLIKAGGVPQVTAAADIYPLLQSGKLDGGIFAGPIMDEKLGFYKVAPYYYFPAWPQPAYLIDLIMRKDKWDGLTPGEQQLFEIACQRNLPSAMVLIGSKEMDSLRRMAGGGAKVLRLPEAVAEPLRKATKEVLDGHSADSEEFKALRESLATVR